MASIQKREKNMLSSIPIQTRKVGQTALPPSKYQMRRLSPLRSIRHPRKRTNALRSRTKYYATGGQSQKSDRHIRKRTIAEIVAFIQNNLSNYSVSQLCSALKFPGSIYYKALVRVPSNKQKVYEECDRKVKQTYDDSKQRYGAVKICHALNDNGTPCSVKRVHRHMAEQGLRSIVVKKYNHHANHGSIPDDKKNILGHDFGTDTINRKWCTDITYIHVQKVPIKKRQVT